MSSFRSFGKVNQQDQMIFDLTHEKHLATMSPEIRKDYERGQIKRIRKNNYENCIEVYFKNGEFFKYTPDLTWH